MPLNLGPSQFKDRLSRYADFNDKDKTVVRPSYLYHRDPYTGKTAYLYCLYTVLPPSPLGQGTWLGSTERWSIASSLGGANKYNMDK